MFLKQLMFSFLTNARLPIDTCETHWEHKQLDTRVQGEFHHVYDFCAGNWSSEEVNRKSIKVKPVKSHIIVPCDGGKHG